MEQILLPCAISAITFVQQNSTQNISTPRPAELLYSFYNLTDTLAGGDTNDDATNSEILIKTIISIRTEMTHQSSGVMLLKDINQISAMKEAAYY